MPVKLSRYTYANSFRKQRQELAITSVYAAGGFANNAEVPSLLDHPRGFVEIAGRRARTRIGCVCQPKDGSWLSSRTRRSGCLHESPDIVDFPGERVIGERLDKNSTILHALDAVIEDGEHAAVGARADQAAEALFQGEDSFRNLVFGKGVASFFGKGAHSRCDDGVGGDGERQAVDDDAGELVAGNVHALPEAGGGEKDGAGGVAESLEQCGTRRGALQQEG